mgnify:FL=1
MADLQTRISGIPCQIEVTSYYPATPMKWFRNGDCAPPEDEEIEFRVLDRKGYPAPWLEKKMNEEDRIRIEKELLALKEDDSDYDGYYDYDYD